MSIVVFGCFVCNPVFQIAHSFAITMDKCQACSATSSCVARREFPWECRPRAKEGLADFDTVFDVVLCERCFAHASAHTSFPLRGHDWWDAFDGLAVPDIAKS